VDPIISDLNTKSLALTNCGGIYFLLSLPILFIYCRYTYTPVKLFTNTDGSAWSKYFLYMSLSIHHTKLFNTEVVDFNKNLYFTLCVLFKISSLWDLS
jgi:hypothetical protein